MGSIFEGKINGSVTVNDKGQIIMTPELRKALNIKTGDQFIILTGFEMNSICLIPSDGLRKFLGCTSKFISKIKKQSF